MLTLRTTVDLMTKVNSRSFLAGQNVHNMQSMRVYMKMHVTFLVMCIIIVKKFIPLAKMQDQRLHPRILFKNNSDLDVGIFYLRFICFA